MMVLYRPKYNTYHCECDVCGDVLDTQENDFPAAIQAIKDHDWQIRRYGDSWTHVCYDCARAEVAL